MFKRSLVGVMLLALALTLWGCGSSRDSDGSTTNSEVNLGSDPATGLAFVGAGTCIGCHEGFSWSAEVVENYLAGKHVIHSDHIDAASGDCLECHDPVGDGPGLEALIDAADVPAKGLAAVGCENCHGAGGEHYGVGPVPIAKPSIDECGKCHNADMDHLDYHPEAGSIVENFKVSRHFTASVRNEAICSRCHTDAGGKLYKNVTTYAQLQTVVFPVDSDEPIQCRTCHDPHNAGGLLFDDIESRGDVVASAEYATCTSCHMGENAAVVASSTEFDDDGNALPDYDATELMYHQDVYYRVITDTHYDDPATTSTIEGYSVNPLSDRACRDCHNIHAVEEIRADDDSSSFSNTINDQWSKSAHGGFIGSIKLIVAEQYGDAIADGGLDKNRTVDQLIAIKKIGVTDADAAAWTHYDWDASNRQDCQRCHTSTGSKNFLTDPTDYDASENDFSHLEGWENNAGVITSSGQNEMLFCWACHSDNAGGIRDPGPITEEYDQAIVVSYPDIDGSNICLSCHLGRETGAVIKKKTSFDNTGFVNSHYLTAGGQLFAETGYEYATRNYNNVSFFQHDQIGTATQPSTGDNGPCVSCHMSASDSHLFLPVKEDDLTGKITAVTATSCASCHTSISADEMNTWKEQYEAGLAVLQTGLDAQGIIFSSNYPYFFTAAYDPTYTETGLCTTNLAVKNWQWGGSSTFVWNAATERCDSSVNATGTADTGSGVMGAAFNLNLLLNDPGGYAHNSYYVKGLLWDAIDYIYNGVLDNDVPAAIAALAPDAATEAAAVQYFGTSRPGDGNRP